MKQLKDFGFLRGVMSNNTAHGPVSPQTMVSSDLESQSEKDRSRRRKLISKLSLNISITAFFGILIGLLEYDIIPSHRSGFYCKDPKLSFIYAGDTVNEYLIISLVIFLPIIVICVTEYLLNKASGKERVLKSAKESMLILRGCALGLIFNFIPVEMIKFTKGDPRPTFFDICNPDTARNCTEGEYINTFKCTPTDRFSTWFQLDTSHSFPSGHTSLSVYTALFMAWYLHRRAFNWSSHYFVLVPITQLLCVLYACVCSISRIFDHRHHWWDVAAGTVIGVITAVYAVLVLCKNFKDVIPPKKGTSSENHIKEGDERLEQIAL